MRALQQRLHRLEAHRIEELLAALKVECDRFAAFYGPEAYREPFDEVLAPFSDAQLEVFCTAMDAWQGKPVTPRLPLPTLQALITAFRRHWRGE